MRWSRAAQITKPGATPSPILSIATPKATPGTRPTPTSNVVVPSISYFLNYFPFAFLFSNNNYGFPFSPHRGHMVAGRPQKAGVNPEKIGAAGNDIVGLLIATALFFVFF